MSHVLNLLYTHHILNPLRGTHTIFNTLFEIPAPPPAAEIVRKGRSSELIEKRNECLVDRYYYIASITGLRYELVIKQIASEFFLSNVTVPEIVQANLDKLVQLKNTKPSKRYFQDKWSHINW